MFKNRYGFYLLGKKGLLVLRHLINHYESNFISFVVIGEDTAIPHDYSLELRQLCKEHDIMIYSRSDNIFVGYDYLFAIGWKWMIYPYDKLIILHDSILPKYRGFAPLVNSLINGENIIGVSALFASEKYDRGDVICQDSIKINYPIKIAEAIDSITKCYISCINMSINKLENEKSVTTIKQLEHLATYSIWRDENDYIIDWSQSATDIKRFVDAVGFPYDGAKTRFEDKIYVINEVEFFQDVTIESRHNHVGKVIFIESDCPVVVCGRGLLRITDALDHLTRQSILPLFKFRIKFY